jgi:cell division protein FtsL
MNLFFIKLVLLALVCVSALACVSVGYESRVLATELMRLKLAEQELTTRWGQLLLEESALGALPRVEAEAVKLVSMRAPTAADLMVLHP